MKPCKFTVKVPIYLTRIEFIFANELENAQNRGLTSVYRNRFIRIHIQIDDDLYSTAVHEIGHATFAILRDVGVKFSSKSEEAYTYLQEFIFREMKKRLDKQ